MKEADMQSIWTAYLKKHLPNQSETYELKICKGGSLPFLAVKEHQLLSLLASAKNGFYHKITDQPIYQGMKTRFHKKKPFDCFCIVGARAYVVLWFYEPRKPKFFIKISVDAWLVKMLESQRKSITKAEAIEIGESVYV